MPPHSRTYDRIGSITSADSVSRNFSMLCVVDRLFCRGAAGVIVSVADDDENSGDGLGFRAGREFVGGKGDSIPQGSASRRHELADSMRDQPLVVTEILDQKHGIGKSDHKGQIIWSSYHFLQKSRSTLLFKLEARGNGIAGIDDETEPKGQFGLVAEPRNGGR